MDNLENLPTDEETEVPPQHQAVMDKFLGPSSSKGANRPGGSPWKDVSKWKIIGCATVAFIALANPWVQAVIAKAPYFGGNDLTTMLLSAVLFVLLMIAIVMFAC